MDPLIQNLKPTTFGGQRSTHRQIATIQKVVRMFPKLSRNEPGHTICTHQRWQTPTGRDRIQQAMRLLEALEQVAILSLPSKRGPGRARQQPLRPSPAPPPACH